MRKESMTSPFRLIRPLSLCLLLPAAVAMADSAPQPASGRAFGYVGTDLDDSATVNRTFAWFADDGTRQATFSLVLPRNADRLVDTYLGNDNYVRPIEVIMAEYHDKPFLHLWGSGFPVSVWPSPERLPYARKLGTYRDGVDALAVFAVAREEVEGKPQWGDLGFTDFRLLARPVPDGKGTRLRVTDLVARQNPPDETALHEALDKLRKYWTGKNTNHIFFQFRERKTPEIERQNLLVFEDARKGVFIHWEKAAETDGKSEGFALYMVFTDKWGYKGGVNPLERRPSPAEKDETPGMALVRGARENNRELVASALAKGADPNFKGEGGATPLASAVAGVVAPDAEILRMLLDAGADPNQRKGIREITPFFALVQSSCLGRKTPRELRAYAEGIRLMLRHGADANLRQGLYKKDALGYAVMRGADPEIVRILVEEGRCAVTEEMLADAKDNPQLLDCLTKKHPTPQESGSERTLDDIDQEIAQMESLLGRLRLDLFRCANGGHRPPGEIRRLSQQIDSIQLRIIKLRHQRIKSMPQPGKESNP